MARYRIVIWNQILEIKFPIGPVERHDPGEEFRYRIEIQGFIEERADRRRAVGSADLPVARSRS